MFNFFKPKFKDESLEDQRKDLEKYPDMLMEAALKGLDCDVLPNATGEFGKTITNPIPVNGPTGEIKYLNRLGTSDGGLIFHRLGSYNEVDIYEVVSHGGKFWDILYLDMAHPRRSTKAPSGYAFKKFHEIYSRWTVGYCTNSFDEDFPFGLSRFIERQLGGTLSEKFAKKYEEVVKDRTKFVRPSEHIERLKQIQLTGRLS